jgi:hypothetical protein
MKELEVTMPIGNRTTKKGKLYHARWGWEAVSFFDGEAGRTCIPTNPGTAIYRKHLFTVKGVCRRCGSPKFGQKER